MSSNNYDTDKKYVLETKFVLTTIKLCNNDKGLAARLRRADNPDTEYQSWEHLANLNINLENNNQRLTFATIASAIAKSKTDTNGKTSLGSALALSYDKNSNSDAAQKHLRRILACDSLEELCLVLRHLLSLIYSRTNCKLNFINLLIQVQLFSLNSDCKIKIKAQWASEFYNTKINNIIDNNNGE